MTVNAEVSFHDKLACASSLRNLPLPGSLDRLRPGNRLHHAGVCPYGITPPEASLTQPHIHRDEPKNRGGSHDGPYDPSPRQEPARLWGRPSDTTRCQRDRLPTAGAARGAGLAAEFGCVGLPNSRSRSLAAGGVFEGVVRAYGAEASRIRPHRSVNNLVLLTIAPPQERVLTTGNSSHGGPQLSCSASEPSRPPRVIASRTGGFR